MSNEPEQAALYDAVHALLRSLVSQGEPPETMLDGFLLVRMQAPAGSGPHATRQVVVDRLAALAEQDETGAEILRRRFMQNETLLRVSHQLNVSEHTVSRLQSAAIARLARLIQQEETALRRTQMDAWQARMPPAEYSRLFGLDEAQDQLTENLLQADGQAVIALVGIGGIGKTALADKVMRRVMPEFHFAGLHWLRLEPKTLTGQALSPELLLDYVLGELAARLEIKPVPPTPEERRTVVRRELNAAPHLVVLDNVEYTAYADYLPDHLADLAAPSKFLLTSRVRPRGQAAIRRFYLPELSLADATALLRHRAEEVGVTDLETAGEEVFQQIYDVTGGNPLALKLVVGMLDLLSLPQLLADLKRGRPGRIEETYRHIYWQTWETLSRPARDLLQAMPLVSGIGGDAGYLQTISGLDEKTLGPAIAELRQRSLLEVRGTLEDKRYGVHRLTETFVRTEIVGWPEENNN